MRTPILAQQRALPALLVVLAGVTGCGSTGEPRPTEALRQMFPGESTAVLQGRSPLVLAEQGFRLADAVRAESPALAGGLPRRGLQILWPAHGEGAVRFELPDGVTAEVREAGLTGEGQLDDATVAYRRPDGASFWSADENGFEEWLHLDEGVAFADRAVASWQLAGLTPRQRGAIVEVVDAGGEVRFEVSAPEAFAAGGAPVPARLSVSGDRIELSVDAGGARVLVDPRWTPTGTMATPRYTHVAELLGSGKVLTTAGYNSAGFVGAAELYEPLTKLWSPAGSLATPRHFPNSAHLPDDRVLIIGGLTATGYLASTELYDPPSNSWSAGPSMSTPRYVSATAATTGNRLVVSGGVSDYAVYLASSEIYDPATNSWSAGGALVEARWLHSATAMSDGRVVIAGGENDTGTLASGEIWNPLTNEWSPTGSLNAARRGHSAVRMSDDRILVIGGEDGSDSSLASAEIYDPPTNSWIPAPSMLVPRYRTQATTLSDGTVLVSGGRTTVSYVSSTEIYDPVANAFHLGSYMTDERYFHTATLLADAQVLVTGGFNGAIVEPSSELYDPAYMIMVFRRFSRLGIGVAHWRR